MMPHSAMNTALPRYRVGGKSSTSQATPGSARPQLSQRERDSYSRQDVERFCEESEDMGI